MEKPKAEELHVKIYSDKEGRQYKITIPKKIVQALKYKHGDEFILEINNKNILLKKVE